MSCMEVAITKVIELAIVSGYDEKGSPDYIDKETLVAMAMAAIAANTSSEG